MLGCTLKGNKSAFSVFALLLVNGQTLNAIIAPGGANSFLEEYTLSGWFLWCLSRREHW